MAEKGMKRGRRNSAATRVSVSQGVFLTKLKKTARGDGATAPFEQDGPEYDLLFQLLQPLHAELPSETNATQHVVVGTSFQEIGALLDEIITGAAHPEAKEKFLDGVTRSPVFYERVIKKLREVTPELVEREIPGFDKIRQKSDAELYEIVKKVCVKAKGTGTARHEPVIADRVISELLRHGKQLLMRPVFAVATSAGIVAVALSLLWPGKIDRFSDYTYGSKIPFESPFAFQLRGGVHQKAGTPEQLVFRNQMKDALSDYRARQFGPAVQRFSRLASTPEMRDLDLTDFVWVKLARELNFFLGISSFAHARTPSNHKNGTENVALMKSALTCLRTAESLASESGDANPAIDRELYFIALIQAVSGDFQASRDYLDRISMNSDFFNRKNELLQRLAKP